MTKDDPLNTGFPDRRREAAPNFKRARLWLALEDECEACGLVMDDQRNNPAEDDIACIFCCWLYQQEKIMVAQATIGFQF